MAHIQLASPQGLIASFGVLDFQEPGDCISAVVGLNDEEVGVGRQGVVVFAGAGPIVLVWRRASSQAHPIGCTRRLPPWVVIDVVDDPHLIQPVAVGRDELVGTMSGSPLQSISMVVSARQPLASVTVRVYAPSTMPFKVLSPVMPLFRPNPKPLFPRSLHHKGAVALSTERLRDFCFPKGNGVRLFQQDV